MAGSIINIPRVAPNLLEQTSGRGSIVPTAASGNESGFAEQLGKLLTSTNDAQMESARMQDAFMAGEPVELHQVMIKAEEAGLTMDLLLEIRNKLVNAVNDLTKMPL
jgi:flagellar hook-basal body complex protein FliE